MQLKLLKRETEDLFQILFWDLVRKTQTEKTRNLSKGEQQELKTERKIAAELLKDLKGKSKRHKLFDGDYKIIGLQKEKNKT